MVYIMIHDAFTIQTSESIFWIIPACVFIQSVEPD